MTPLVLCLTISRTKSLTVTSANPCLCVDRTGTGSGGRPPPHLEVGLLEDAGQLVGRRAAVGQRAQVLQDVLHQLHVVVTHRLQLGLLKVLMGLADGGRGRYGLTSQECRCWTKTCN